MLSVAKLSPGQEAYYERSVADGIDDYYAGRGESPGVWAGAGAGELELEGVVGDGELGRLISGRHPHTSDVLRSHPPKKRITVERIDTATGQRHLEVKTLAPVAGYDLVFSPPKSVSLLHALGNDRVRHAVDQAHLAAWQAALAYLEQEACVTRRGKNGRIREHNTGFVAAAYQHRNSRAQDPHLHTHVIVANMTKTRSDGEWRALDGEPLLKHHRLAAGYLYQVQLRHELTRSLGLEWHEPRDGMAEIAGVPEQALRAFSQRRAQVLDYLEQRGSSGFYAAKVAAIATRERKEPVNLPRLRLEWQARAAEHGLGRRELKRLLGRTVENELDERQIAATARRLLGPEGLTEKRSTFTSAEAVMAWAQAQTGGAPAEDVIALAGRFLANEEITAIAPTTPGRPAVFSTAELLRHERVALELAEHGRNSDAPTVSPAALARLEREYARTIGREQAAMLRAIATSRDRIVCVVGHAGETSALAALTEAYQHDGHATIGAAPSGIAAANLATQTGIPTATLHRLLHETRRRGGLPLRCLLVVDEAGMADTRTLTRLLFQLERVQGKAVLVGDPAQLSAVGPGGLFSALVEREGAIELRDNHRQRTERERNALAVLRDGRSRDYLVHQAASGRLTVAANTAEAKARLLADWWRAAATDLNGSVMIAYRRTDVADLNRAARTLLDREGRLGRERLRLEDGREFAAGDRVLCTRNNSRLGIANGDRGTVTKIDQRTRALTVELDPARLLQLPRAYLAAGHVSHAYALTGHKTQRLTVEQAFVLAHPGGQLKEWGYVALSRARDHTRLYTAASELDLDASPHRPEPAAPLDRLAAALTRPAAQTLALDASHEQHNPYAAHEPVGKRARKLATRVHSLDEQRSRTARQLQTPRRELADMGALRRARHGRVLRDRITEREQALAQIEAELKHLNQELRRARQHALAHARARSRLDRDISRERTLERGLRLGRSLDRAIEI